MHPGPTAVVESSRELETGSKPGAGRKPTQSGNEPTLSRHSCSVMRLISTVMCVLYINTTYDAASCVLRLVINKRERLRRSVFVCV